VRVSGLSPNAKAEIERQLRRCFASSGLGRQKALLQKAASRTQTPRPRHAMRLQGRLASAIAQAKGVKRNKKVERVDRFQKLTYRPYE